ncbi:TPA: HNH endonuclease, partial [Streptococcus pyogenes]|nr:HNH endonuclease [Streptococcus pyogenes]
MWVKIARNTNYSINENGVVRNDITGRIKKPFTNKRNGYLIVDLYKDNKSEKVPIHRLVAEAFIPNLENKATVDHIDGDRKNNSINNLRWATYSENNSRFETIGVRSESIIVKHYAEERKKRGGGHLAWLDVIET